MAQVLRRLENLPPTTHPDLLVGIEGGDDAGVFRLDESMALVQTVDFFTPIVDEADDWGRIAAANALSDVYAMGGSPLTALQMVGWPRDTLPFELLGDVLVGAAEIMQAAGVTIVGGHSIDDPEPKFGLAITGTVDPGSVLTNRGAAPGDVLVLTKPIGTGLIATAIKRGLAPAEIRDPAVAAMISLNDVAGAAAREAEAAAVTDVTGFGLLGHLHEMLDGVGAAIDFARVPLLAGAAGFAADGVVPGGTKRNLAYAAEFSDGGGLDKAAMTLLADAQTSGGLLIAVAPDRAAGILDTVKGAAIIGEVTAAHPGRITIT